MVDSPRPTSSEPAFDEIEDDGITWRVDRNFMQSTWTCIWGRGCQGILDEPAEQLGHGCCSVGAELTDLDEAMTISALAAAIPPDLFQHASAIDANNVFSDASRTNTKVVDGACIFLNRPGFIGGAGCALHLAAQDAGEAAIDWKPSVCWQLPIKVDWDVHVDGTETATVRAWQRRDWGDEGTTMAWCCTEQPEAYVGDEPVIQSLASELHAVMGETVFVELQRRHRTGSSE